jgi:hypothetical protein
MLIPSPHLARDLKYVGAESSSQLHETVFSEESALATPFNPVKAGYSDERVATRKEDLLAFDEVEGRRREARTGFGGFLGDLLRVRVRAVEFAERVINSLECLVARFC